MQVVAGGEDRKLCVIYVILDGIFWKIFKYMDKQYISYFNDSNLRLSMTPSPCSPPGIARSHWVNVYGGRGNFV